MPHKAASTTVVDFVNPNSPPPFQHKLWEEKFNWLFKTALVVVGGALLSGHATTSTKPANGIQPTLKDVVYQHLNHGIC